VFTENAVRKARMPRKDAALNAAFSSEGSVGPPASGQGEIGRKFIRLEPQEETRMAKVIPLPDLRSRSPRRAPKEPVEAKILLFTGVRYERLDVTSGRPGAGPKRVKNK